MREMLYRVARRALFVSILLVFFSADSPLASDSSSSTPGEKIARIKNAMVKSLCYDVYWAGGWGHGEHYQRGVQLPFKIVIEGEKFYARVDPIGFVGKDRQPARATRIGIDRDGRTVVISNYEKDMEQIFSGSSLIEDALVIPTDCTPHYDPPTPQKERMLQTVVSTMQKQLSSFVRMGAATYPQKVTLTIADFNIDYPSTYILVEPPGHLYTVTLHNPQNYESDEYEREGEYPLGEIQVKPHLKPLLAKIRKHGVIREIVLTP